VTVGIFQRTQRSLEKVVMGILHFQDRRKLSRAR
jgi:hypothetical protein